MPPRLGSVILLGVAVTFAANHLAARIAFDHGASVVASVATRSTSTALVLLLLMWMQRVTLAVPRALRGWALVAGLLIASQSYCLYSAVALIPPALALLTFQCSPMLYVLISWAMGKEKPSWTALPKMLLALTGLALALGLNSGNLQARWNEIGTGVLWAFASGASMSIVYYLNTHMLKVMDGRVRTFAMTAVTATLMIAGGTAGGAIIFPRDVAGWMGLAGLTFFYCIALITLFSVLPRLPSTTTAALNLEPIALLFMAWIFLGQTMTGLQIVGAFLTVGAIGWLGLSNQGPSLRRRGPSPKK